MARVEFYVGTTLIGTDTTSPYSASWSASAAGSYALKAIAYDADGGSSTSALVNVTVSTMPTTPPSGCPCTIWNASAKPINVATGDWSAVELGVRFRADTNGTITGGRFHKSATNTGTHTASLWTDAGTLLATATFTNETASGWQQVSFTSPVAIVANTTYVMSYHTDTGQYNFTTGAFATTGVDNPPLHALATGVGTNGVYRYGTTGFPNQTFEASNYWVDVVFNPSGAGANLPPTVAISAPANGASITAPSTVTVSASATDPEGRMARVEFYVGTTLIGTDTTSPYSASWSASAAGSYALNAIAYDADGGSSTSAVVNVTVTTASTPIPKQVVFVASTDHATSLVTSYLIEVFANGANPQTATPIASSDLGKGTPATNGDITVDRTSFFAALPVGTYVASVSAVGPGGKGRGGSVTFSR
jgi:hypothetical protein